MAGIDSALLPLSAHPDSASHVVRRVAARVELAAQDLLRFHYLLEADPGEVRIPPPVADAGRADKLWAHTCFEAFVGSAGSAWYVELNFSPSGAWAAYRFDCYRQGMAPALDAPPRLALHCGEGRLELQAEVHWRGKPSARGSAAEALPDGRLRVALSTVVEDRQGRLSYWALRHPPGRPDFHHPDGFSLALELPAMP